MGDSKRRHLPKAPDAYLGRALAGYRTVAVLLLNTLVLFLLVEAGVTVLMAIGAIPGANAAPDGGPTRALDPRAQLAYYQRQVWATTYWTEFDSVPPDRYSPWVIWSRPSYRGQTINIDGDGHRVTPGATCGPGSYTVFVFGGSAVWGTGSPDWATIPAYLQAGMQTVEDRPVCVKNFGEAGFVSTQGLIELLVQLRDGNVPDLVIFYDGVNDVLGAYQSRHAGAHHNLSHVAALFEDRATRQANHSPAARSPLVAALRDTNTYSLLTRLVAAVQHYSQVTKDTEAGASRKPEDDALAQAVADVYLENYRIVGALAQDFGFSYGFFWQPVVSVGSKPLVGQEPEMLASMAPGHVELNDAVYRRIELAAEASPDLYYVADVFDGRDEPLWIDPYHVTPEGNRLVAQRMLSSLRQITPP